MSGTVAPRLRVRRDALPENVQYRDDGCDIHPHCLTCPLPRCRYDESGGIRALLNAPRDAEILALRDEGLLIRQLAARFGLKKRQVYRIQAVGREAAGPIR